MPGLEQHREHPAPQLDGAHPLRHPDPAALRGGLVLAVAAGEGGAVEIVQVGDLVGGEQRPVRVGLDTAQELVWHPVRGVHVVGATPVVTGVLAQVEELLDVDVPRLQVRGRRTLALAALVDRDRGVRGDLEERDDAWDSPLVPLMCAPRPRTGVQSLPRPPEYLASSALFL